MPNSSLEKQKAGFSITFLFFFVLGAYPFLSFIWRRSYPVLTSEVFVILLVLASLGLILAATLPRIRLSVMALVTALLITVVFLIQFNLSIVWALTVFAVCVLLIRALKSNFFVLGLTVITVMLAASLVENLGEPEDLERTTIESSGELAKPPVIHIILDGFIGVGGLPAYSASPLFQETVEQFFEKYDFELFPNAYSRYPTTARSLYSAMNFSDEQSNWVSLNVLNQRKHKLETNAYFDILEKSGYSLNVYQTEHLDFCQTNLESINKCWAYAHPNILTVREVPELQRRVSMLGRVLLSQSSVMLNTIGGLYSGPGVAVYDPRVIEVLKQDLFENPDGGVFFVHLLIPHHPFVFLNDCSIRYEANPALSVAKLDNEDNLDPEVIEYRTLRYFEQSECALATLAKLFDEMKLRSLFDQAYIVLHGDHGSHISRNFPSAQNYQILTAEDYKANFSTLFAVKTPFGKFALDSHVLPISTLLEKFGAGVAIGKQGELVGLNNWESFPKKRTEPYVFLHNVYGLQKVDINIFDESTEN